jgi:uncharacterized protein with HEPN domain
MPSEAEPTDTERLAWRAIQDNAMLARSFVEGMTVEAFCSDRKSFYAATRCLEIISEAARRLRGRQQARFPELEWRLIEDSGNVFRHKYQVVAETRVWLTVQDRLPDLLAAAEAVLGGAPPRMHESK